MELPSNAATINFDENGLTLASESNTFNVMCNSVILGSQTIQV